MSRIRKRRRRNRRIAGIVVGLSILYLVFGFLVLPRIVKAQVETRLTALLSRPVEVAKVRANPLSLSVTLEGFSIKERDGSAEFAGWDRLYVNAEFWTSLIGAWRVREIALDGFRARAVVHPDGTLNVSDLLEVLTAEGGEAPPDPSETQSARPVVIGAVTVTGASVTVADDSRGRPFRTELGPLSFVLTDFHSAGATDAPYHFAAVTEAGERLEWSGTLKAAPFESQGTLQIDGIVIGKYAPYHAPYSQADVRRGTLSFGGRYEINLAEGSRTLRWHEGEVSLKDIEVVERANGRLALELPALSVSGIDVDAVAMRATIGRVAIEGGKVSARREVDGTVNLLRLAQAGQPAGVDPAPVEVAGSSSGLEFAVSLAELAVTGLSTEWVDLAAPWPAQLDVSTIDLTVTNLTNAEGAVIPFVSKLAWAPAGTVDLAGEVVVRPSLSATLNTTVANLDLVPLGPYVEGVANARIARGTLSLSSQARLSLQNEHADWAMEGDVGVNDLALEDPSTGDEIAGFDHLEVAGVQATPAAVTVAGVSVRGPRAVAMIAEDGSLNLAKIAKESPPVEGAASSGTRPAASAASPIIEIRRVSAEGGDFRFVDRSVEPNVRVGLSNVSATVIGLSSATRARGDVEVKASFDGVGPVGVTGRLDPLGAAPLVDVKVDFQNVDLPVFSPYSAKYAGYELARGKLNLDVAFRLDGTELNSNNVVTLDGFTFGAPSNSPDATRLPVRLAVALLKDTEGQIVIDVPVQGKTDDPEFRVGRVVMRVLVNLLTKAATSPFALLGSMFGGGGEELAFQEFAPGTTTLLDSEKSKLATMTKALSERPGLNLAIAGSVDVAADTEGLRKARFESQLRSRLGLSPEDPALEPDVYAVAVKAYFDDVFPPGTEGGTPLPPPPPTIAPPPPSEGVIDRLIDAITLKTRREQQAAEAENERRAAAYAAALEMIAAEGLPLEEMVSRLTARITIGDEDLRALAAARAAAVRQHFIDEGEVSPERLFIVEDEDPAKKTSGARTLLTLQ
jgi:hypothetical protein